MAKTHYYPGNDDEAEYGACGTYLPEDCNITANWSMVNCKRCLNRRADIEKCIEADEEFIIKQMGDMADFFEKEAEMAEP